MDLDEEYDHSYYEDYDEYEYDYEYEDELSPAVAEGYEFEYEVPVFIKKPSLRPKPLPVRFSQSVNDHPSRQTNHRTSLSGSNFLSEVTGEDEDSFYNEEGDGHVRTEMKRLPGGRVSTQVSIEGRASTTRPIRIRISQTIRNKRKPV